jgi:hypothetical protein
MATGVGLRIGDVESVAAVVSEAAPTAPEYLVRNTDFTGGPAADPNPTLVATEMLALLGDVTTRIAPPDSIVATYPSTWTMSTVEAVRTSLTSLGLDEVALVVDDGTPTVHQSALRGAQLAAASLAASTTTIRAPKVTPVHDGFYVGARAYSALPDAPAAPLPSAAPAYLPPVRRAPATMEFAPIPAPAQRRSAAGSVVTVMLAAAFVLTVIAGAFYFGKMLPERWSNLGSQPPAGYETTEESSEFDLSRLTERETAPTTTSSPEITDVTSETTVPTTSASTSTSEQTLTNSAGSSPLDLG